MSALSTKRLTMNVFMPLTLAVFLWIINPGYINEFFSTTHGVLIVGCFILILAINAFLIRGSSGNTGSHFWLVALLTIMAFLIIIFGPAFLKVMMFLPADSTVLKTTALITLILFNAGLAIGLFALGRKMIKKRMLIRFISGFLKASNYPPSLTARNLCSSLQHSPIFKQRIQLIISLGILTE